MNIWTKSDNTKLVITGLSCFIALGKMGPSSEEEWPDPYNLARAESFLMSNWAHFDPNLSVSRRDCCLTFMSPNIPFAQTSCDIITTTGITPCIPTWRTKNIISITYLFSKFSFVKKCWCFLYQGTYCKYSSLPNSNPWAIIRNDVAITSLVLTAVPRI